MEITKDMERRMNEMTDTILALDPEAARDLLLLFGTGRRAISAEAWKAAEARVRVRATAVGARHLGLTMTVRTAAARVGTSGSAFTGRIVAVEYAGVRRTARRVVARWAVTLEGPTGRRETFTLEGFTGAR